MPRNAGALWMLLATVAVAGAFVASIDTQASPAAAVPPDNVVDDDDIEPPPPVFLTGLVDLDMPPFVGQRIGYAHQLGDRELHRMLLDLASYEWAPRLFDEPVRTVIGRPRCDGPCDEVMIRRSVKHHVRELERCVRDRGGAFDVRVVIASDGKVQQAGAVGDNPEDVACIAHVARSFAFRSSPEAVVASFAISSAMLAPPQRRRAADDPAK